MSQFSNLGLSAPITRAVEAKGYLTPTPIQIQAIPLVLEGGDLLGIAATGTGKTAAFALPILHRLQATLVKLRPGYCRALVLCPTRELCNQIAVSFKAYSAGTGLLTRAVYGGVSFDHQAKDLRRGADIVVATPGRLIDHLERNTLRLDQVDILVLDEADHMLDLGFIPAVRRIVKALPRARQTLFFSATMPDAIRTLANEILKAPKTVAVTPSATTVERVEQRVIFTDASGKKRQLVALLSAHPGERTLVFTRTKRGADRVTKELETAHIAAAAIHGNKSQNQRERALEAFRKGQTLVLVATDIAARGIDVGGINLVVNFDLPEVPETYVHRIGRTARAGAAGLAVSLCAPDERHLLKAIERVIRQQIASETAKGSPRQSEPAQASARVSVPVQNQAGPGMNELSFMNTSPRRNNSNSNGKKNNNQNQRPGQRKFRRKPRTGFAAATS